LNKKFNIIKIDKNKNITKFAKFIIIKNGNYSNTNHYW